MSRAGGDTGSSSLPIPTICCRPRGAGRRSPRFACTCALDVSVVRSKDRSRVGKTLDEPSDVEELSGRRIVGDQPEAGSVAISGIMQRLGDVGSPRPKKSPRRFCFLHPKKAASLASKNYLSMAASWQSETLVSVLWRPENSSSFANTSSQKLDQRPTTAVLPLTISRMASSRCLRCSRCDGDAKM